MNFQTKVETKEGKTVDFLSSWPVNEKNSIAIQGQKDENREDSGCVQSDSFPLCYASSELLRHMLKISKQEKKIEDMICSAIDYEKGKQSCHQSQPMEETTVFHGRLNHKEKDEKGEQLELAMHSNPSFYEQKDNHSSDVHEESHPNFSYEE